MFCRRIAALLLCGLVYLPAHAAGVTSDNLQDGKGIITDYTNMTENEAIEWIWISPNVRLSQHGFVVAPAENLTSLADADMERVLNSNLDKALQRVGAKNKGAKVLHVKSAVYWAARASAAKRWIPYAGGHLAQAGVGIELVFSNDKGEIVAKVRHSGREGEELQHAAEELVEDIRKFVEAS